MKKRERIFLLFENGGKRIQIEFPQKEDSIYYVGINSMGYGFGSLFECFEYIAKEYPGYSFKSIEITSTINLSVDVGEELKI